MDFSVEKGLKEMARDCILKYQTDIKKILKHHKIVANKLSQYRCI
jgi:hypothetical protein